MYVRIYTWDQTCQSALTDPDSQHDIYGCPGPYDDKINKVLNHDSVAALAGIKVIKIFENWTSQTCRRCNQRGTRRTQGLFVCKTCGEDNADRNASFNIAYRALGYISKVGVTVNIPITLASTDRSAMMTRETRKRLPVFDRYLFTKVFRNDRYLFTKVFRNVGFGSTPMSMLISLVVVKIVFTTVHTRHISHVPMDPNAG
jgi:hypothetical protein